VPPLRERRDDIPLLLKHYIAQTAEALAKPPVILSDDALFALTHYDYPGNIRELKTMIQDAVSRNRTGRLNLHDFTGWLGEQIAPFQANTSQVSATDAWLPEKQTESLPTLEQATRQLVVAALERCNANQSEAARVLGISRQRLARILEKHPH